MSEPPHGASVPPAGASAPPPPREDRTGDEGAESLLALYRLLRTSLLHDADNDAVTRSADNAAAALSRFHDVTGRGATFTFVRDMIFTCGQLLSAPRTTYDAAVELGELLARCRVTELAFHPATSAGDLVELARCAAPALRSGHSVNLADAQLHNIALREVEVLLEHGPGPGSAAKDRVLDTYASAVVVLRDYYEQVASGATRVPRRVRRVAQRLCRLSLERDPAFASLVAMAPAQRDVGARAVQVAAIVAAAARAAGVSSLVAGRLVTAALTADTGLVRASGLTSGRASAHARQRVLGSASVASLAAGGAEPAGHLRTVIAFELAWLEHADVFGALYGGRSVPLESTQLVAVARALLERIAPRDGSPGESPAAALAALEGADHWRRALGDALGIVPAGTLVELADGGARAVVVPADGGALLVPLDERGDAIAVAWEELPAHCRVLAGVADLNPAPFVYR